MTNELHAFETLASCATSLPAFHNINLSNVRDGVSKLLTMIGRHGVFEEYTDHSFEHVSAMIHMLDWLLIEPTQRNFTPGDWLTLILAIYFHDLGMVVTNDEFNARDQSDFRDFCTRVLFAGDDGVDYTEKVSELGKENAEKFLYQEFVRQNHAERVRRWIMGDSSPELGVSTSLVKAVQDLIGGADELYREDLASLCASHHADNIDLLGTSKPYGDSEEETVNLHFLAVVLRVVDLLQVTKARTPGILYRTINPRDPISQVEWKKQSAVRRVRPAPLNAAKAGQLSDTIEIHATFNAPAGYFGLTSYIEYARRELARCYGWVRNAQARYPRQLDFPWRNIDDSNVDAKGFLKETFRFELDNYKVLDLLTGHTLYNDSSVVVRELAQNAIDAVRLQYGTEVSTQGRVDLRWNSATKTLLVTDNGTGMTQAEIVNNLLKVGASRYQDVEFKRKHPSFYSISRFGIGILSAFMVADEVVITTVSKEDDKARRLTLKSVHGNYLIELIDKNSDAINAEIRSHGTEIALRVRASAKISPLGLIAKRFVYFPQCRITCRKDDGEPEEIGFADTASAMSAIKTVLESKLSRFSYSSRVEYRVVTVKAGGFDISFLVQKWPYSDTWTLVSSGAVDARKGAAPFAPLSGICVEGIFVKEGIPGFKSDVPVCLVNATGENAPHANVARNDIEFNKRYLGMIEAIFGAFAKHVSDEFEKMLRERERSLTYASNEAMYMISGLLNVDFKTEQERRRASKHLLGLKVLAVETDGVRKTISFDEANSLPEIRLVECPFFSAAEAAIAELASHASISEVVKALGAEDMQLDKSATYLVGGLQGSAQRIALSGWQIGRLVIDPGKKRIDAIWTRASDPFWYSFTEDDAKTYVSEYQSVINRFEQYGLGILNRGVWIATGDVSVETPAYERYGIAIVGEQTLLLPASGVNVALIHMFEKIRSERRPDLARYLLGLLHLIHVYAQTNVSVELERHTRHETMLRHLFAQDSEEQRQAARFFFNMDQRELPPDALSFEQLLECINGGRLEVFFAAHSRRSAMWGW